VKQRITRRGFLCGLGGGVAIALPPLQALWSGRASAGGAIVPPRFVMLHLPEGCDLALFKPAQTGANYAMPPLLHGIEDLRDRFDVVTGLSNFELVEPLADRNRHPLGTGTLMAPFPVECPPEAEVTSVGTEITGAGGRSVDHELGDLIGAQTKARLLYVRAASGGNHPGQHISFSAPSTPTTMYDDPRILFDAMFLDLGADPSAAARLAARRGRILDHVLDDIHALSGELGAADQARLDEHLTAIEELEQSVAAGVSADCEVPPSPGAAGSWDTPDDSLLADKTQLLLDLSIMALRCDLTRVLVFSLSETQTGLLLHAPGLEGMEQHGVAHNAYGPEAYDLLYPYHVSWFRPLLDGLAAAATSETTTLLDHCAVVCASEFGPTSHSNADLPVLVAGGLGSGTGGRHLLGNRPMADLWLTVLHAFGDRRASYGNSAAPIDGLWAG
jgi:hypothetical protein